MGHEDFILVTKQHFLVFQGLLLQALDSLIYSLGFALVIVIRKNRLRIVLSINNPLVFGYIVLHIYIYIYIYIYTYIYVVQYNQILMD